MFFRLFQILRKALVQQFRRLLRHPPPPEILRADTNFSRIDAQAAVDWLRALVEEALTALLEQTDPKLEPLFQSAQAAAIISVQVRPQVAFKRSLERSLAQEQAPERWRHATIQEIERQLNMHDGYTVPSALWELLLLRALGDGQFIEKIAYQVEATLVQRVYYDVNPPPKIAFSIPAYCWLLAVAPIRTDILRGIDILVFTERQKAIQVFQRRCRDIALAAMPLTDPWDQWLVFQTERAWISGTRDRALREAIQQLPLVALRESGSFDNLPVWFKDVV